MTYTVNVYECGPTVLCDTWGTDLNFRAANDLFDYIVDEQDVNITDNVELTDEDGTRIKVYDFESGNIDYSEEFYALIK